MTDFLLQDLNPKLFRWFATRIDSARVVALRHRAWF